MAALQEAKKFLAQISEGFEATATEHDFDVVDNRLARDWPAYKDALRKADLDPSMDVRDEWRAMRKAAWEAFGRVKLDGKRGFTLPEIAGDPTDDPALSVLRSAAAREAEREAREEADLNAEANVASQFDAEFQRVLLGLERIAQSADAESQGITLQRRDLDGIQLSRRGYSLQARKYDNMSHERYALRVILSRSGDGLFTRGTHLAKDDFDLEFVDGRLLWNGYLQTQELLAEVLATLMSASDSEP